MGLFFGAHRFGDSGGFIPAASFLRKFAAGFDDVDLARNFVFEGAPNAAEAVHVFDLDLGAELFLALWPDADVYIASNHALFHVAVADTAIDEDVLEGVE